MPDIVVFALNASAGEKWDGESFTQIDGGGIELVGPIGTTTAAKIQVIPSRRADRGDGVGDPGMWSTGEGGRDRCKVDVAPGDVAVLA